MIDSNIINLVLTAAAEEGGRFNWGFVAEHLVNLIILLGVLVYFLRDPLKNFLIERRGTISNEIDKAQATIAQARKDYEEYNEKFKKLDEEMRSLRETIRREGETERKQILRQAEAFSQRIREEARETIRLETEKARQEIRSEAVSLAVASAEEIIRQNLKESDERRFIENFINTVEKEKWQQSQH
ncbi:MAG TPA: ATP synthase F0 subunit B [Thermodesulfobacteriota bacterium]|nr:ATP synthase F0 subunit B [Thermodesulfobacteriota bacterium]